MARKKSRKRRRYNKHHRKPKSRGGGNSQRNISIVPIVQHQAWHTLFANQSAEEIAEAINRHWLDPDYKMVAVRKRE